MKNQVRVSMLVPESVNPNREVFFCGNNVEEALNQLSDWVFFKQDFTDLEGCTFRIEGDDRLFEFNSTMFHYCFAKGRISVDKMLDECCYEK